MVEIQEEFKYSVKFRLEGKLHTLVGPELNSYEAAERRIAQDKEQREVEVKYIILVHRIETAIYEGAA